MHQIADELKFLKAQDLGILQSRINQKLSQPVYQPYLEHIDNYVLSKLKWWSNQNRHNQNIKANKDK